MTHDEDFEATEKPSHAQTEMKEKMVTLQQNHNINSVNGDTVDCTMHEAQFPADIICDLNTAFESEEHFAELHNKSNTTCTTTHT